MYCTHVVKEKYIELQDYCAISACYYSIHYLSTSSKEAKKPGRLHCRRDLLHPVSHIHIGLAPRLFKLLGLMTGGGCFGLDCGV